MFQLLLSRLGLGNKGGDRPGTRSPAIGGTVRRSQEQKEHDEYSLDVRKQLIALKKKGLSIPVFTL